MQDDRPMDLHKGRPTDRNTDVQTIRPTDRQTNRYKDIQVYQIDR